MLCGQICQGVLCCQLAAHRDSDPAAATAMVVAAVYAYSLKTRNGSTVLEPIGHTVEELLAATATADDPLPAKATATNTATATPAAGGDGGGREQTPSLLRRGGVGGDTTVEEEAVVGEGVAIPGGIRRSHKRVQWVAGTAQPATGTARQVHIAV